MDITAAAPRIRSLGQGCRKPWRRHRDVITACINAPDLGDLFECGSDAICLRELAHRLRM
jgi:hypothetical protein